MSIANRFQVGTMTGIDCDQNLIRQACRIKKSIRWPDNPSTKGPDVYFRTEDIVLNNHTTSAKYDVITCLSVTKWIHLNHGDRGVVHLFRKCFDLLADNGVLILEPQPWRSYHRKRNISPEVRQTFEGIQLRPDNFTTHALPEAGFVRIEHVGVPQGVVAGFRRPVYACYKKLTE
mmetsp:Transcript_23865/g.37333  ORF Transcript_23865/g.37333 Transcript_23865/m.37333 type:complete len:175 (-) Transcript_23865:23-547(-)